MELLLVIVLVVLLCGGGNYAWNDGPYRPHAYGVLVVVLLVILVLALTQNLPALRLR